MQPQRWKDRFFGSTRGRILTLLRRAPATVNELAAALEVTDNAVRTHLAGLERDGLAEQRGVQRGVGKPAYVYGLTAEAEGLFPKAYGVVLQSLLDVLRERTSGEELKTWLEEAGQRLAAGMPRPAGDLRARVETAAAMLGELGGMAEAQAGESGLFIRGYSCPLRSAVEEHPEVCQLAAALLTELVGVPVRERCDRDGTPRCCFEIGS